MNLSKGPPKPAAQEARAHTKSARFPAKSAKVHPSALAGTGGGSMCEERKNTADPALDHEWVEMKQSKGKKTYSIKVTAVFVDRSGESIEEVLHCNDLTLRRSIVLSESCFAERIVRILNCKVDLFAFEVHSPFPLAGACTSTVGLPHTTSCQEATL